MGVFPRLVFDDFTLINCCGMTFIFMVRMSFYEIFLIINNVMFDITTTLEGPRLKHFSSNWHTMQRTPKCFMK